MSELWEDGACEEERVEAEVLVFRFSSRAAVVESVPQEATAASPDAGDCEGGWEEEGNTSFGGGGEAEGAEELEFEKDGEEICME